MKTIKITEQTHNQLVQLQAYLMNKQGIKYTFNELINWSTATLKIDQEAKYEQK